jgi:membrane protein implicated in regulation of membrane protease activity
VFLVCFIGGMLLGVRIMIAGVERPREDHPAGERSFRLSPPVLSGFLFVFGAAGYIALRRGSSVLAALGIAVVLAALAAVVAARLVRKWWLVVPEHDVDDERYVLQGTPGRVTRPIRAGVEGEVTFELGSERHVVPARSFDDTPLDSGVDVVIERIEGGVAYVEAWAEVEKRL